MDWKDKLTTRNIIALATVGIFLRTVDYLITNGPEIIEVVNETEPAVVGAAGIVVGAFVVVTKDVYTFFFRKKPKEE